MPLSGLQTLKRTPQGLTLHPLIRSHWERTSDSILPLRIPATRTATMELSAPLQSTLLVADKVSHCMHYPTEQSRLGGEAAKRRSGEAASDSVTQSTFMKRGLSESRKAIGVDLGR